MSEGFLMGLSLCRPAHHTGDDRTAQGSERNPFAFVRKLSADCDGKWQPGVRSEAAGKADLDPEAAAGPGLAVTTASFAWTIASPSPTPPAAGIGGPVFATEMTASPTPRE
jgi:hypothetical protein